MPNPGKQQKPMPLNILGAYLVLGTIALGVLSAYIYAWVTDPYDTAGITGVMAVIIFIVAGVPWALVQLEDRHDR